MSKMLGKGHAGCPFCPDKAQYIKQRDGFWFVDCYCGISGPAAETEAVAIAAWDSRQPDKGLITALEKVKAMDGKCHGEIHVVVDEALSKYKGKD